MNCTVPLMLLFGAAGQVGAQGVVRGTVAIENGQRVAGVEVRVAVLNRSVRTDSTGEYKLSLPPGRHWLTTRAIGFVSVGDSIVLQSDMEAIRNFTIKALVTELDTVTSTAPVRKYLSPNLMEFQERQKTGQGRYVPEEEFRRSDHRLLADVLRRVPGLLIQPGRNGAYNAATSRNSSGRCFVAVFLDGMALYNGPRTGPVVDLREFSPSTIAGAEFYATTATSPVRYKDLTGCGMLLLWTRER